MNTRENFWNVYCSVTNQKRDETAKDNHQTAACICHDLIRNNELAFSSNELAFLARLTFKNQTTEFGIDLQYCSEISELRIRSLYAHTRMTIRVYAYYTRIPIRVYVFLCYSPLTVSFVKYCWTKQ